MRKKLKYITVTLEDLRSLGIREAIFYAYLMQVSQSREKERGFFELDMGYICRGLGITRRQAQWARDKLVRLGRISYVSGKNQNQKPRWKIL